MRRRDKLQKAQSCKNDEFYTQMDDIETECSQYLNQFKNKVIYCNCDTENSNFVKYFQKLEHQGKIKKLIYSGGLDGLDFRSSQSIELLKQADIVVSNPPFSLFREYINQLIEYDKKFLIIGNQNAITYKSMFKLIHEGKLWIGTKSFGVMLFDVPNPNELVKYGKLNSTYRMVDGTAKAVISAVWFTNLECAERKLLPLSKTYVGHEQDYPKYDNYDAISINRKTDIPMDYNGVMGVPVTFLDRYNPRQFEILGLDENLTSNKNRATINGKRLYARIFMKRRQLDATNDNIPLTQKVA